MYKMKGFNTQIAFCVLAAIVLLNVHFHICATAQATGTVSRSSTISRQAARVSRTPEFAVLARGGSSPPDPELRTCAAATGFFGRGFKVIAKCDPKSWLAGGPYKLTSGPPANMKSTISQSNKELFVKLNGKLPTDYVTDTTARTGEATAEIIGHAHIGACDLTQAQLDGDEGLGSVTGKNTCATRAWNLASEAYSNGNLHIYFGKSVFVVSADLFGCWRPACCTVYFN